MGGQLRQVLVLTDRMRLKVIARVNRWSVRRNTEKTLRTTVLDLGKTKTKKTLALGQVSLPIVICLGS